MSNGHDGAATKETLDAASGLPVLRPDSVEQTPQHFSDEKFEIRSEASVPGFDPPNGGLEAWLLVAAGFCVFVNTWGITSSFGAFQAHYKAELLSSVSSSAISWIGSIQAFLVVFVGTIVGPLFDRGHLRVLSCLGCFLIVFGMMMTSVATRYYQMLLAQGICVGLGEGIIYVPSLAVIATHFTTKRPIAIGLASIGSCVGGIAFPIMFRKLEPRIGFGWAIRSIAFLNLAFAAVTVAILARNRTPSHKPRSLLDMTAFRESAFVLFTAGLFFVFMAYYVPLFFVTSFATTSLGTSEDFAFYLLAIMNASSLIGRTVPYVLGQRVRPVYVLVFWSVVAAILILSWIGIHREAGFIVWVVLWGCVAGGLVTAPTSTMPHPVIAPSLRVIGTRMGMIWAVSSTGILAGGPIAGALIDVDAAYFVHAQIFGGVIMAVGVSCLFWPLLLIWRHEKAKGQTSR